METADVQNELFTFLERRVRGIQKDALDEVLVSYLASLVEELSQAREGEDSDVDEEAVMETLAAYVPDVGGSDLTPAELRRWVEDVAARERDRKRKQAEASRCNLDLRSVIEETAVAKAAPQASASAVGASRGDGAAPSGVGRQRRISKLSETSDGGSDVSGEGEDLQVAAAALLEMFPYSCSLEATHCLHLAAGDVEAAAQMVMHRHETGQSLKPQDARRMRKNLCRRQPVDDKVIKNQIVGKYGFVDQEDDARYHRPTIKRDEDKKLIRYRDGKIVSTKGERFTQVSKQESEEMKKSIVNNHSLIH